jgi:hypothetical protein
MSRRIARTLSLSSVLAALLLMSTTSSAGAYGSTDQWQAGFSGTCSSQSTAAFCGPAAPAQGALGFWGWCAFGGSNGTAVPGTVGTTADCQVTTYFGPATSFHIDYNVTKWMIQPTSPLTGGLPDFLFIDGTVTLSGPGVPPFLPSHTPIPIPSPCPLFVCDSGIPAIPGHFALHPSPGAELEVQVTELP